jgi:hypothetical protein
MRRFLLSGIAVAVLASCSDKAMSPTQRAPLSQRAHDSVIGTSGIPGASGIRSAQRVGDSLDARRARIDSASRP